MNRSTVYDCSLCGLECGWTWITKYVVANRRCTSVLCWIILNYSLSSLNLNINTSYLLALLYCVKNHLVVTIYHKLQNEVFQRFLWSHALWILLSLFVLAIRKFTVCRYYLPKPIEEWCFRLITTYMWVLFKIKIWMCLFLRVICSVCQKRIRFITHAVSICIYNILQSHSYSIYLTCNSAHYI